MILKEWLDDKGLDIVKTELEEILSTIGLSNCTVDFDDDGSFLYLLLMLNDGSHLVNEFYYDEEINDDFSSKELLLGLYNCAWQAYCDYPDEFNSAQQEVLESLNYWEQKEMGYLW